MYTSYIHLNTYGALTGANFHRLAPSFPSQGWTFILASYTFDGHFYFNLIKLNSCVLHKIGRNL